MTEPQRPDGEEPQKRPATKAGILGWLAAKRQHRRKKKEIKEHEEAVEELNITAMLDMMTIILVFLLKSYSASSTAVTLSEDLMLPMSASQTNVEDAIRVTISQKEIAVDDKVVCHLVNGAVDPSAKRDGDAGYFITPLFNNLLRHVMNLEKIAKLNPKMKFRGRIIIIGDKNISYRLLTEVLYTAGQARLGNFRLMVLRKPS
jgi:biopolymer transport protein ExbD